MTAQDINLAAIPNMVCSKCDALIDSVRVYLQDYDPTITTFDTSRSNTHIGQYNVSEAQLSGLNGCHVCSIITQAVCPAHSAQDITTSLSIITIHITPAISGHKDIHSPLIFLHFKDFAGSPIHDASLSIEPRPMYGSPVTGTSPSAWSMSTGSDAMFDLARGWLTLCLSQHELCEEIRATPVTSSKTAHVPMYLVKVDPDHLQLCRSKDLPTPLQYLTLSHRWGGSHILQLTSHNHNALLSDISIQDVPKTFQDAIEVTRRLGYQYIWIDSLCIIQDSVDHWRSESAIMGDIYRGSICTIAALGATDGDSGCFKARNPLAFQDYSFKLNSGRTVYLPAQREKTILGNTGYRPTVEPLHERAWVIQERMLSPRTLFYGTFGLYWECGSGTVESNLWAHEMRTGTSTAKYVMHQSCSLPVSGRFDESYRMFSNWWTKILSMYNPCGLTYGSDKLVAIAGIVKLIESKTGLHNIAGLWREYIFPELLWIVNDPLVRDTRSYQAPTWSWASLNGGIRSGIQDFNYNFDWKLELLDAVADLAAENGQLSGAYIRVRGPLCMVRWESVENGYKLRWGTSIAVENSADDRVVFLPDVEPEPTQEIWALLVAYASSSNAWMNMGLVVAKRDVGGCVWVRVGSFRQYDWPGNSTEFFAEGQAQKEVLTIE